MTIQELRQKIHDRIYGDIVERWRAGKLDDRRFGRAYRLRAQVFVLPLFFTLYVITMVGQWLDNARPVADFIRALRDFALLYGIFALAIGAVIDRNASFGVRDMLLRRNRADAECEQLVADVAEPCKGAKLEFRSYTRTSKYWNHVLVRVVLATALFAVVALWDTRAQLFLIVMAPFLLWALTARFDRRPYLEFSPDGIWCRAWGKEHLPFSDFKAVYRRQNGVGEQGVVLVPHAAAQLAPKLSWQGRYAMRSGENVPAHAGTLTIWTSKVGLDRDLLLECLQAQIRQDNCHRLGPATEKEESVPKPQT